MNRTPVESSMINAVGYDEQARQLEVEFRNGQVYRFSNVPADIHSQMMSAPSVGKYFGTNVRGKFSYSKG